MDLPTPKGEVLMAFKSRLLWTVFAVCNRKELFLTQLLALSPSGSPGWSADEPSRFWWGRSLCIELWGASSCSFLLCGMLWIFHPRQIDRMGSYLETAKSRTWPLCKGITSVSASLLHLLPRCQNHGSPCRQGHLGMDRGTFQVPPSPSHPS